MKRFKSPQLYSKNLETFPLSSQALLSLMQSVLSRDFAFRFMAKGWSMSPFIRNGDVITIEPIKSPMRVGDVVAFIRPQNGKLVVHRIVAKHGNYSWIIGDSIPDEPDGMIPFDNILGRVSCIERDDKNVWLGLGPERFVVAWLSRVNLLVPLRLWINTIKNLFVRKKF